MNIAIFISGAGTNMMALHQAIKKKKLDVSIVLVVSSQKEAKGLDYCKKNKINHIFSPPNNQLNLCQKLQKYRINLIVLAGYMHIIDPPLLNRYKNKIINIHPSLLPKYKGLNTHSRVLANNERVHGSTVHFVDQSLDGGKSIAQTLVEVSSSDTTSTLENKIKQHEWLLLPRCVELIRCGKISHDDEGSIRYNFTGCINSDFNPF